VLIVYPIGISRPPLHGPPPDLDHRGLDGLEGPLASAASGQITLESCGQMPDSDPSSSHADPKRTVGPVVANVRAAACSHSAPGARPTDAAPSSLFNKHGVVVDSTQSSLSNGAYLEIRLVSASMVVGEKLVIGIEKTFQQEIVDAKRC